MRALLHTPKLLSSRISLHSFRLLVSWEACGIGIVATPKSQQIQIVLWNRIVCMEGAHGKTARALRTARRSLRSKESSSFRNGGVPQMKSLKYSRPLGETCEPTKIKAQWSHEYLHRLATNEIPSYFTMLNGIWKSSMTGFIKTLANSPAFQVKKRSSQTVQWSVIVTSGKIHTNGFSSAWIAVSISVKLSIEVLISSQRHRRSPNLQWKEDLVTKKQWKTKKIMQRKKEHSVWL